MIPGNQPGTVRAESCERHEQRLRVWLRVRAGQGCGRYLEASRQEGANDQYRGLKIPEGAVHETVPSETGQILRFKSAKQNKQIAK